MKRIRIGQAGLGRLGRTHAKNIAFRVPGAELAAVASPVQAELDFAKNELGVDKLYTDIAAMCADPDLDAIAIITPSTQHPEHIRIALESGKHIFCEKPLAVTVEECREIEKLVEAHPDQIFMLGFMRRYDPSYAYAKKKIDEGAIGTPYLVKAIGVDPDADAESLLDSGYVPRSGGLFMDMASHDIDLMRWFMGSEIDSIVSVGTTVKHARFTEQGDVETAIAQMTFKNGGLGQLHIGRASVPGYDIETEIIGTEGSLRVSPVPFKNRTVIMNKDGAVQECVRNFPERFEDAYILELMEFVSCVQNGTKPGVNVYDGTNATIVAFAGTEALKTGKIVKIDY